jgi:hypothetical protein
MSEEKYSNLNKNEVKVKQNLKILQNIYQQNPVNEEDLNKETLGNTIINRNKTCKISPHLGYAQYGENPVEGWKKLLEKEGKLHEK